MINFNINHRDPHSKARTGLITTSHGNIETPVFMPVGTVGSVKAVGFRDLDEDVRARIILGNTYHLYLRPGLDILSQAGGLHGLIGWKKPILTDSGGYQIFSLSNNRKLKEEGAIFQSHIDGSRHVFTPEYAVDIQRIIGADIVMAFDECTPYPSDHDYARNSMELTHRWLDRCINRFNETEPQYGHDQTLFPIVQGSVYRDLRIRSAEFIAEKNAGGNAIGGLSVGEPSAQMYELTELVCSILPDSKPRYLMGVGTPWNILECISLGVDMFDCVMPTRNGRNGQIFTREGFINLRNKKWANDFSPIEENGASYIDTYHTKAYLRHLFAAGEILAGMIASLHNLAFYLWLVDEAHKHIEEGDFFSWKTSMVEVLKRRL